MADSSSVTFTLYSLVLICRKYKEYLNNTNLDKMIKPDLLDQTTRDFEQARKVYRNSFDKLDMLKSYETFFSLLWYSQLPCFDVAGITAEYGVRHNLFILFNYSFLVIYGTTARTLQK